MLPMPTHSARKQESDSESERTRAQREVKKQNRNIWAFQEAQYAI